MNNSLVSVILAVYNAERFLKESIESVLNQTHDNIQLIIVDDGSTDSTPDIVRSFDDSRIEFYQLPENRHIAYATNVGLRHVRGEYCAIIDGDDIWVSNKVEKQLKYLQMHPEHKGCFTWVDLIDENGDNINGKIPEVYELFASKTASREEWLRFFFFHGNRLNNPSSLICSETIEVIGDHNQFFIQVHDMDWWVRFTKRYSFGIIEEPLVKYRRILGSDYNMSISSENNNIQYYNELMQIHYHFFDDLDDELFISTFKDYFVKPNLSSKEDLICEKLFLLLKGFHSDNIPRAVGLMKMNELLTDSDIVNHLWSEYCFGTRACGEYTKKHVYNDLILQKMQSDYLDKCEQLDFLKRKQQESEEYINYLHFVTQEQQEALQSKDSTIQEKDDTIHRQEENIRQLQFLHTELSKAIDTITSSKSWKITAPLRKILDLIKKSKLELIESIVVKRRKKMKQVLIYAYLANNLGDDLFVKQLCKRYPHVLFHVIANDSYKITFQTIDNCYVHCPNDPEVLKVNAEKEALGISNGFFYELVTSCDAVIHIGGSVFVQHYDNWSDIYSGDAFLAENSKGLYQISGNFGPYTDEAFYHAYHELFKKYKGICFRDKVSYGLFKDIPHVSYVPDALWGVPVHIPSKKRKKVVFSLIELGHRKGKYDISAYQPAYLEFHIKMVRRLIQMGYEISLLSFCTYQKDIKTVNDICKALAEDERQMVRRICYENDTRPILKEFEEAEAVVGTRFHSVILGMLCKCKVLPIIYDQKTRNTLDDMAYTTRIELDELSRVSIEECCNKLFDLSIYPVNQLIRESDKQFQYVDYLLNESKSDFWHRLKKLRRKK